MSLLIVKNNLKKKKSNFFKISINCFAHYQHNYWHEKKFEKIYFWYLNEMITIINDITKFYNSSIILNGFAQKKIKHEYYLRPNQPKLFFEKLKVNYLKIEPNMTTGALVYFKSIKDKNKAIKILKKIKIYDYSVFEIQDYKSLKKIFYKFALVSKKNKYHPISLSRNNYKKFFKKPDKTFSTVDLSNKDKLLINFILKDTIFMKSSSRHINTGEIFYKNFKFMKQDVTNKKIHNIKIFKNILKHFN